MEAEEKGQNSLQIINNSHQKYKSKNNNNDSKKKSKKKYLTVELQTKRKAHWAKIREMATREMNEKNDNASEHSVSYSSISSSLLLSITPSDNY